MEIDAKSVLYRVIEKMGKERIESEIVSNPSNIPKIISEIHLRCIAALRPYDYDKEKVHSDLVTALMHYLLAACLIQAERKIEYEPGIILDVVIPSVRQLRTDPKRTLLLAFPKSVEPASINAQAETLQRVQPDKENIWLLFGRTSSEVKDTCKDFRRYVPDESAGESLRPLSSIIDDIKSFLEIKKVKSFKIFPS